MKYNTVVSISILGDVDDLSVKVVCTVCIDEAQFTLAYVTVKLGQRWHTFFLRL